MKHNKTREQALLFVRSILISPSLPYFLFTTHIAFFHYVGGDNLQHPSPLSLSWARNKKDAPIIMKF